MTQLFANNAFSTLAAAATAAATSLSVQPGQGARFPAPTNGDFFALTLFQLIGGVEANHEVVYVTARSVDTLTITRAQEGTTARAWGVGDQVSHRGTAGTMSGLAQLGAPAQFTQPVYVPTPVAGANTTQAASTAFVTAAVQQVKADLIANSPGTLDTLSELASALGNDANFSATTAAALGNRLRVDVNTQGLSAAQKANAVTNLGLAAVAVSGSYADLGGKPALAAVATSGAKADVGLGNADNTSDANKPVSTAQAAALALKAPLDNPALTNTVTIGTPTKPGAVNIVTGGATLVIAPDTTSGANGAVYNTSFAVGGAGPHIYQVGGAEKMRLSATGTLLIGTTSDNGAAKLQVAGRTAYGVVGVAGQYALTLAPDTYGTGVFHVKNSSDALIFGTGGDAYNSFTEGARLTATGNLLVGTTTDTGTGRLQVNGSSAFTGQLTVNTTTGLLDVRGKSSANIVPDIQISRTSTIATVGQGANIQFNDTGTISNSRIIQAGAGSMQFFGYGGGGWAEHMRIDQYGNVGIGGVPGPTEKLYLLTDNGKRCVIRLGQYTQRDWYVGLPGGSPNFVISDASASLDRLTIDTNGNLLVGVTSGACHMLRKTTAAGNLLLTLDNNAVTTASWFGVDASSWNGSATAYQIGKNNSTGRSINAGGTVNASGADYAEYMTKADACGVLAKGQIVGIDATGKLTDQWASAMSFLVKSTDPSYVGGDVWGSEEALGIQRPVEPQFQAPEFAARATTTTERTAEEIEAEQAEQAAAVAAARNEFNLITMPAYEAALVAFNAALEVARQKVDRIAYCGQVPVNVTGATPGQYVVPVQDGAGIKGVLVNKADMTLAQYMSAVGVVQNLLPDGRANVRVKPV